MTHQTITMFDVAYKLGLPADRNSLYVDCPNCHGKRKLNINYGKNVFRCNKCGDKAIHTQGGPLDLYMLFMGIDDIREAYRAFNGEALQEEAKPHPPAPIVEEETLAPLAVRDATYRALLSLTNLHDRHREDLLARGLSEENIRNNGYRSLPSDPKAVALKLLRMGCTIEGVPGFFKDKDGSWTMMCPGTGFLIPQRNSKGQIQGFQIRLDQKRPDMPRYISLSSRDRDGGAPAHAYVHFRRGEKGVSEVILTEGALKADVICALSGYSVLSVPGVNSQKYLPGAFKALIPRGLRKVRIAYDMDAADNIHVQAAQEKLIATLNATCTHCGLVVRADKRDKIQDGICPRCGKRIGLSHSTMRWNPDYKGLDDYLNSKRKQL